MDKEFETKVLDINVEEIIHKLRSFGAEETPEILMRRYVFDNDPHGEIEFFRIREFNGKVTLAYKHKIQNNTKVGITSEIEVESSNFDGLVQIFSKIPFKRKFYQENKRKVFKLSGIEYSIDSWPMLPPFLEIESTSKEKIHEGLVLLGLSGKDCGDKDIKDIYKENGIDIHKYNSLKF